jgi:hypothetical protein
MPEINKPMKIKITENSDFLKRVGGESYAAEHAGKTYDAVITEDGWARIEYASFPPDAFEYENHN